MKALRITQPWIDLMLDEQRGGSAARPPFRAAVTGRDLGLGGPLWFMLPAWTSGW